MADQSNAKQERVLWTEGPGKKRMEVDMESHGSTNNKLLGRKVSLSRKKKRVSNN